MSTIVYNYRNIREISNSRNYSVRNATSRDTYFTGFDLLGTQLM